LERNLDWKIKREERNRTGTVKCNWDDRDCAVLFRLNKQKVNTRSSTETELITVDDALPTIQLVRSFMKEQGYDLDTEIKRIIEVLCFWWKMEDYCLEKGQNILILDISMSRIWLIGRLLQQRDGSRFLYQTTSRKKFQSYQRCHLEYNSFSWSQERVGKQ